MYQRAISEAFGTFALVFAGYRCQRHVWERYPRGYRRNVRAHRTRDDLCSRRCLGGTSKPGGDSRLGCGSDAASLHQRACTRDGETGEWSDEPQAGIDAELQAIVDAWPTLPEALRAGMVAMVRALRPDL